MTEAEFRSRMLGIAKDAENTAESLRRGCHLMSIFFSFLGICIDAIAFVAINKSGLVGSMMALPAGLCILAAISFRILGWVQFRSLLKCRQDCLDDIKRFTS